MVLRTKGVSLAFLGVSFSTLFLIACSSSNSSKAASSTLVPDAASSQAVAPADAGADVSASACTLDDTSAGQHTYSCDGLTYDVHIPAACASSPCGLVVDVHGLSMSGKMEDNNTNLRTLGEQHGYVIVQPNAVPAPPRSSWNLTDDPKVFAFIQLAVSTLHVDAKRVHMTGFSEGGFMSYRFLCEHADYFASVAPAAGAGCSFGAADAGMWGSSSIPAQEIPVLAVNGTLDALVNFNSRAIPQRDTIIAGWHMDTGAMIAGDGTFTRTRYTSPSGTVFEFIQHDYSSTQTFTKGHCFPGSQDLQTSGGEPGQVFGFGCQPPNSFVWGDEVMRFFIAHPKK
jgi:dienelactone hydrolase